MILRLIITLLGNLVDTISTLYFSSIGFVEANPIMRRLLNYPVLFIIVKQFLIISVCCFLWIRRKDKHAMPLATFAAVVYGLITIYYCIWFVILM